MKTIGLKEARKRLGVLWLTATALTFLIMVARSLLNGFGDQVIDAWGWYLPTLVPTLGVILSTFSLDLEQRRKPKKIGARASVEGFYYRLCWWMSLFYLANILLILVLPADWLPAKPNPIQAMIISNIWVGPLQGLTAASLAWFFFHAQEERGETC